MIGKIVTFIIFHHPDSEIGVDVVEPGLERLRIAGVAEQSSRNNSTASCIMATIDAVCIRHTAGYVSIPGKIGAILSERPAEPDISRRIHTRIGTGIKVMQAVSMRMGQGIVVGIKYSVGKS